MTELCHIDEIADNSAKGFLIGNDNLFAIKKQGAVYVYRNRCPHLGLELNWQPDQFLDFDGALIQCSSHGALFIIEDGSCVGGPCIGQQLEAISAEVRNSIITLIDYAPPGSTQK